MDYLVEKGLKNPLKVLTLELETLKENFFQNKSDNLETIFKN